MKKSIGYLISVKGKMSRYEDTLIQIASFKKCKQCFIKTCNWDDVCSSLDEPISALIARKALCKPICERELKGEKKNDNKKL